MSLFLHERRKKLREFLLDRMYVFCELGGNVMSWVVQNENSEKFKYFLGERRHRIMGAVRTQQKLEIVNM